MSATAQHLRMLEASAEAMRPFAATAAALAGNAAMIAMIERHQARNAEIIAQTDAILNGEPR